MVIRFAGVVGEAGQVLADIPFTKGRCGVNFAGQEAFAQRAEAYEADAKFFQDGQDLGGTTGNIRVERDRERSSPLLTGVSNFETTRGLHARACSISVIFRSSSRSSSSRMPYYL